MRNILYISTLLLFLSSCVGANYYLKQGNYDAAINTAVAKLRKNPKKADKHILALETAYNINKNQILDRIEFLKLDGSPESWVEIHDLYAQLDAHQKAVKPFLPLFIQKEFRNADIQLINVNDELIDAKQKAASFLYAKGEQLLSNNSKQDARTAYGYFQKVKEYYGNFKDVDAKTQEAYNKGLNHVLVGYSNHSNMIIPQSFMNNISQIDERALDDFWVKYHVDQNDRSTYDYLIEVHVTNVDIGPEQVNNSSVIDKKTIEDGRQYVLDDNGNVVKDEEGNDVTEPAYTEINAIVYSTSQTKVGTLGGVIQYKKVNGTVFKNFPFQENLVFKNNFASFQGDKRALSAQSKKIIGGQAIPFPSNLQMVMDASEIIKNRTYGIIKSNQGLVLN